MAFAKDLIRTSKANTTGLQRKVAQFLIKFQCSEAEQKTITFLQRITDYQIRASRKDLQKNNWLLHRNILQKSLFLFINHYFH